MADDIAGRMCEMLAATAPAVSPRVVIITRGELEIMLLRAVQAGMDKAVEIMRKKSDG